MINDVGHKIQIAGKVIIWAGIIASIIVWIALLSYAYNMDFMDQAYGYNTPYIIAGWMALIFGCIGSLFGGWVVNGFGTIVQTHMPKPTQATLPKNMVND